MAIAVAALRERIAQLGGLQSTSTRPQRVLPTSKERAAELGFAPEETGSGPAFVRRVSVDLTPYCDRAGAVPTLAVEQLMRLHGHLDQGQDTSRSLDEVAVLDIETTGLRGSGVVAFLVGIGRMVGKRFAVDQVLVVDPSDEAASLVAVAQRLSHCPIVITYNGRGFDVPVLESRSIVNRLNPSYVQPQLHCDLLGPVRRLFRDRLQTCTLRQAEVLLLGFERTDDIPGREAPARYHAWLNGAPSSVLEGIVHHNQIDLCSTYVLAAKVARHVDGELIAPVHPADHYSLGVYLDRSGVADIAHHYLDHALRHSPAPWNRRAGHRLARQLVRRTLPDRVEAERIWRMLWESEPTDLRAARALAISLERRGELSGAAVICDEVGALCRRLSPTIERIRGARACGWAQEWLRRQQRLAVRIDRQRQRVARALFP